MHAHIQVERRATLRKAKEASDVCLRRRKEQRAADADVRARLNAQVEAAKQAVAAAKEDALLESCIEVHCFCTAQIPSY